MVATSKYTAEQKRAFVELAQRESRAVAAKKAGVTPRAISHWAKAIGVSLMPGASVPKTRPASEPISSIPTVSGELALARQEIASALQRLDRLEAALRRVIG